MKRYLIVAPALIALGALMAGTLMMAGATSHDDTFYACLYAGSLSQVNTNGYPANCGRGTPVSWNAEDGITTGDMYPVTSGPFNYPANQPATMQLYGTANCDPGDMVISGGYRVVDQVDQTIPRFFQAVSLDGPNADQSGWEVRLGFPGAAAGSMYVYALCLDVADNV